MEKPSDLVKVRTIHRLNIQVIIPANIDDIELIEIVVDVVNCEIPLLLSKQFMEGADSTLDFVSGCITMHGK